MKLQTPYIAAFLIWATVSTAAAAIPPFGNAADKKTSVKSLKVERSENNLFVSMQLDLVSLKLKSDREITYIPVLSYRDSYMELPHVVVAGRNRYIQNLRHGNLPDDAILCRPGKAIDYSVVVPYEPWMETATLSLSEDECGCGFRPVSSRRYDLAVLDFTQKVFSPSYVFITPVAEPVKTREVRGSAYIDFPVNGMEIHPDYRRNPEELQKIRNTINVLRRDTDTRIVAVTIQGFASPEGPYADNERLAKGRTSALADYVRGLYAFDPSVMKSTWVAEDWAGLRRYVEASDIADKASILSIIDMENLSPDDREWKLKSAYPDQYRFLLENVYPGLRHSDYTVEYVIRSYADADEIKAVLKSAPQKLSLHEMNIVAQSLEPGSDEYREVFEVAVRMYPDDPVANLNAANIALGRDELERAAGYLSKAGNVPEAVYARGLLAVKRGDYDEAVRLFDEASRSGVGEASEAVSRLRELGMIEQTKKK